MSVLLCTTLITRGPRSGQRCLAEIRGDEAACRRCRISRRDRDAVMSRPETERDRTARELLERMRAEIANRGQIGMEDADGYAE